MNKTKIAILGIVALFAVLTISTASAGDPTLYFVPQHSNVSGYGDTTNVEIWLNVPADKEVAYGQLGFSYDPLCGNITSRTLNAGYPPQPIDPSWSTWNFYTMENTCWNDTHDWIVYSFWWPQVGVDVMIGNFTVQGNSTGYCMNNLNFTYMLGCPQGKIYMWNSSNEKIPFDLTNGTFACGGVPPPETFAKTLVSGWNLISLPLINTTMTVGDIINTSLSGSYDALYKYDTSTHRFVPLSSTDTMENGVGYFINMTAGATWTYSGSAYTSMNVELKEGLNMVGWLNSSKLISGNLTEGKYWYVASWNATATLPSFETFNPVAPDGFNDFDTMERGEGYFISAKESCWLNVSC